MQFDRQNPLRQEARRREQNNPRDRKTRCATQNGQQCAFGEPLAQDPRVASTITGASYAGSSKELIRIVLNGVKSPAPLLLPRLTYRSNGRKVP
jgi:hypothetical protein